MSDESPPPVRARPRASRLWLAALLVLGVVLGVAGYAVFGGSSSGKSASPAVRSTTTTTVPVAISTKVYRKILPSLVLVQVQPTSSADPTAETIGSGTVINAGGQILTAYHVVRGAATIDVVFADGTKSPASVVGSDPGNDIAVLQPDQEPSLVVPAVLGSDRSVRVGDEAFSAGNPLGLTGSFTAGVISGLDRTVPLQGGGGTLKGVLQFDAAVNPGSSGGPLLNRDGQVIGVVTGLANPDNQNVFVGIGFAVPITAAGGAANAPRQ